MSVSLPLTIPSGVWNTGHCQGIAVDEKKGFVYFSFTTALIKTDLQGRLIGSVTGLLGHLGCIALHPQNGYVYGSLEYKHDSIVQGILKHAGSDLEVEDAFFIAIFDPDLITRPQMDAARDGVMKTVYLREVVQDYLASVSLPDGRTVPHRHGCSGIDGVTFGPVPGFPDSPWDLWVAYGVYGDPSRSDNDYQVLLRYDISDWNQMSAPLIQENMHHRGPEKPNGKYFLFTGNTCYGVQNLEYDPYTGNYLLAVYRGEKSDYPNAPFYVMDGSIPPIKAALRGFGQAMQGDTLSLAPIGNEHPSGVYSFPYGYGQTGLCSLGNGYYYVSYDSRTENGWQTLLRLCRWDAKEPLTPVE